MIDLRSINANAHIVTIAGVEMLFSYGQFCAFNALDDSEGRLIHPDYVCFSPTTSKALNAAGFKNAPVAASPAEFEREARAALKKAV